MQTHSYSVVVRWTGNTGAGTKHYRSYERSFEVAGGGPKPVIMGSSDPVHQGDAGRWNPEELLVAALSACHQLWYLHLCADAGVVVVQYVDHAEGILEVAADGSGHFVEATLRPEVTISVASDVGKALALHEPAHAKCFIANSINFPVRCRPAVRQ
jgi:organic hydroperoxide reductase OsmC/OhrA